MKQNKISVLSRRILCIVTMAILTKTKAEERVYELTEQLIKTKLDSKDVVAGYKEKIKDIEAEIKAVIEEFNATEAETGPEEP